MASENVPTKEEKQQTPVGGVGSSSSSHPFTIKGPGAREGLFSEAPLNKPALMCLEMSENEL